MGARRVGWFDGRTGSKDAPFGQRCLSAVAAPRGEPFPLKEGETLTLASLSPAAPGKERW